MNASKRIIAETFQQKNGANDEPINTFINKESNVKQKSKSDLLKEEVTRLSAIVISKLKCYKEDVILIKETIGQDPQDEEKTFLITVIRLQYLERSMIIPLKRVIIILVPSLEKLKILRGSKLLFLMKFNTMQSWKLLKIL